MAQAVCPEFSPSNADAVERILGKVPVVAETSLKDGKRSMVVFLPDGVCKKITESGVLSSVSPVDEEALHLMLD
jgi:hypothetical protein